MQGDKDVKWGGLKWHIFFPSPLCYFLNMLCIVQHQRQHNRPNSLEKQRLPFGNSGSCTGIKWCPGAKIMLNLSYMGKLHIDQPKSVISGRAFSGRDMPRSTFSLDVVDSLSPQCMDLWELPLIIFSHFFFFCQPWKNNWFPEDKGSRKQEQRRSTSTLKPSSDPVSSGSERIWNRTFWKRDTRGLKPGQLVVNLFGAGLTGWNALRNVMFSLSAIPAAVHVKAESTAARASHLNVCTCVGAFLHREDMKFGFVKIEN